jgi:hypothetical protein
MSLQQIKQEIAKLPLDEVAELQAWLNQQEREEELADLRLADAVKRRQVRQADRRVGQRPRSRTI